MKQLIISKLAKIFKSSRREVTAIKSIDLTIEPKEFFVLLGPSGCGKSTLLNLIAGLELPTGGEIVLGNEVLSSPSKRVFVTPRERNVAMVFQNYALYPHMSVADNIAFPLKIRGVSKEERKKQVNETAEMLGLLPMLNAKPAELSGGQRQRVAIARAIIRKPSLFLLDEPLSNLDAQLRASTRNYLKKLQQQIGVTTIYVTHDQVEAMTLGDRVALLNGGSVEQVGTPGDLYNKPVSPFAATFIGSPPMNIVETIINRDHNNKPHLEFCGVQIPCPHHLVDKVMASANNTGYTGIRPENITVCDSSQCGGLEVEVTGVEKMGREEVIYTSAGKSSFSFISSSAGIKPGERINIKLDLSAAHFF